MCITALAIPPNIDCRKKHGQFSCGIPGPDDIMVRGARTHIGLTLTVAQPSDTNMVTDFSLDPEHTCGIWWHYGINTDPGCDRTTDHSRCGRTTDPNMALNNSLVQMSPWPQMAVQATQILFVTVAAWAGCITWPQEVAQTMGLCTALNGCRSHNHQLKPPRLLKDLGTRLALGNNRGTEITLDSSGKQIIHISLFFTPSSPLQIYLSPQPMNLFASISLLPHPF